MHLAPQPRFRFYGSPGNYLSTAAAVLTGRLRRGADVARLEERVAAWTGAGSYRRGAPGAGRHLPRAAQPDQAGSKRGAVALYNL